MLLSISVMAKKIIDISYIFINIFFFFLTILTCCGSVIDASFFFFFTSISLLCTRQQQNDWKKKKNQNSRFSAYNNNTIPFFDGWSSSLVVNVAYSVLTRHASYARVRYGFHGKTILWYPDGHCSMYVRANSKAFWDTISICAKLLSSEKFCNPRWPPLYGPRLLTRYYSTHDFIISSRRGEHTNEKRILLLLLLFVCRRLDTDADNI